MPDAEGIADSNDDIANLERVRIAELEIAQGFPLDIDLEHRQIGAFIGQHDPRGELAPVRQRYGNFVAVLDDMLIGDDVAVGRHDHAGAKGVLDPIVDPAMGNSSPKKWRKNGSSKNGERMVCTTRRLKIFTTAGAASFTSGA